MTDRNELLSDRFDLNVVTRLELSRHAMVVVQAPEAFVVRCLEGGVWITQDGRFGDFFLQPGECYEALARKRVFLDAFKGALLDLCGTATCRVDVKQAYRGPRGLLLKVAQGAYRLSGGNNKTPFAIAAGNRNQRNGSTPVAGCLE